jgi:glutathione S-transferase
MTCIRIAENAPVDLDDDTDRLVTACVFPGDGETMSFSPYSTKLLMYLRLSGIPHSTQVADVQKAPKSKVPYIEHGKNVVGDSQLIIRYLENTHNVKKMAAAAAARYDMTHPLLPFDHLSVTQQAKSDCIRLTCESDPYWALISLRWGGEYGMAKSEGHWDRSVSILFHAIPAVIRPVLVRFIRGSVLRDAYGQGFCRHSVEDQLYLVKRAFSALSGMLGTGPFFLGKTPSECDCIAYGTVDQFLADSDTRWPNELGPFLRTECPNLVEFRDRIRSTVFKDVQAGQNLPPGVEKS